MILGVDPGITGALAWTDGTALSVRDMPVLIKQVNRHDRKVIDHHKLEALLRSVRLHTHTMVIEQVGGMPGQSGPAAFTFGHGAGLLRGMAQVLGYTIEEVAPSRWKAALAVPADKDGAMAKATELWPAYAHLWPLKKHNGRAEAALIVLYGWQTRGSL